MFIVFYILIFAAYFIMLNNQVEIIWSFPVFVFAGLIFAYKKSFGFASGIVSVILIMTGSIFYLIDSSGMAGYVWITRAIFAFVTFFSIFLYKYSKIKLLTLISLALPISTVFVISFTGLYRYQYFYINTAILGYYLLISVFICLFLVVLHGSELKLGKKFNKFKINVRRIKFVAVAILFAIVFLPVWYIGSGPPVKALPYINISFVGYGSGIGNNGGHDYFLVNITKYQSLLGSGNNNIAFFGSDYAPLYAKLANYNSSDFIAVVPIRSFGGGGWSGNVKMVFMPINESFNDFLMQSGATVTNQNYTQVNYSSSGINGIYRLQKYYKLVYAEANRSYLNNYSAVIDNSYSIFPVCVDVVRANLTVRANAGDNGTFSIFVFSNSSIYAKAQGIPFVNINGSLYPYPGFLKYSNLEKLNSTSAMLNVHLNSFRGCFYIGLIATGTKTVYISINGNMSYKKLESVPFYAPAMLLNSTEQPGPNFGGIFEGIYYLYANYAANES